MNKNKEELFFKVQNYSSFIISILIKPQIFKCRKYFGVNFFATANRFNLN